MSAELRPSFQLELPTLTTDETVARLRAHFDPPSPPTPTHRWTTEWAKTHVLVAMRKDLRHLWSPWLNIDIRTHDQPADHPNDNANTAHPTYIFARFSPHPALWTAIALTYLALASLILFGACFGTAQWMLGTTGWAWYVVTASAIIAFLIWWASQIGQRLAREHMAELKAALDAALA